MRFSLNPLRLRPRVLVLSAVIFVVTLWTLSGGSGTQSIPDSLDAATLEQNYPLAWKHIHSFNGTGGAWYIPPEWVKDAKSQPQSIVEAAELASTVALAQNERQVAFSKIPLLMHQTSKSSKLDTWKVELLPWVEKWLEYAVSPENNRPMAYFFWDDDGIQAFMEKFEVEFIADFNAHFTPVERADIFRVLACKRFGGVYGDVDTEPLRHPADWIHSTDIAQWTDQVTGGKYGVESPNESSRPVNLVWGLEADTDPNSDTYWRMGYTYPVQITQWALASAPKHPALDQFMANLKTQIQEAKKLNGDNVPKEDPLTRTGPAAVTLATSQWLEKEIGFRWNALTGLQDGGKSKLVSDVLVLPMTAFSPGRGKYGNMGSKPVTDPDARLVHHALGSWKHFNLVVEYGKFCRTFFGMCKDWTKVPT